jgi:hypothetical protein
VIINRCIDNARSTPAKGVELDRSTLSSWVGQAVWLLDPVVAAIRKHVFEAKKIHGDDTTVPVLAPGLGRTKPGEFGFMFATTGHPSVPSRRLPRISIALIDALNIQRSTWPGLPAFLQADGYNGFDMLYDPARTKPGPITEVAVLGALSGDVRFTMRGRPQSHPLPNKRSIRSLKSIGSKIRHGLHRPGSGSNIAVTAAAKLPSIAGIRALTYSTLFGLIAVTGIRISEAPRTHYRPFRHYFSTSLPNV